MSLINQMLKDLQKRTRQRELSEEEILSRLPFTHATFLKSTKKALIILSVLWVTSTLIILDIHKRKAHQRPIAAPSVAVMQPAPKLATLIKASLDVSETLPKLPSVLTGISIEAQDNTTVMRFLLSQSTLYQVSTDNALNKITLTFENTNLLADLPPIHYVKSAVTNLELGRDKNGNLSLTISLISGTEISQLLFNEVKKDAFPELQLTLLNPNQPKSDKAKDLLLPMLSDDNPLAQQTNTLNIETNKDSLKNDDIVQFIKKPVTAFNAEQQFDEASHQIELGLKNKAIKTLSDLLLKVPTYDPARMALIEIYLQQGQLLLADDIIDGGLYLKPESIPFVKLKAHILIRMGKLNQALKLMQQSAPALATDTDYYALMAALYHRVGNAAMSESLYRQLVAANPQNALWWMGLGIAEEGQGKNNLAKQAYHEAATRGTLKPELRAYVETRIQQL